MTIRDKGEHIVKERLPEKVDAPADSAAEEAELSKPPPPYKLGWPNEQCVRVFRDKTRCGNQRRDLSDTKGLCALCEWKLRHGIE